MNRFLFLIAVLSMISSVSYAQSPYEIHGRFDVDQQIDSVYLYTYNQGRQVINSARVENNTFVLRGNIDKVLACSIRAKGWRGSEEIYLEPGKFEVLLYANRKQPNLLVGGLENAIQKSYQQDTQHLLDSMRILGNLYEHGTEEERIKIGDKLNLISVQMDVIRDRYIDIYPASLAILETVRPMFEVMNFQQLSDLKARFSEELAYTPTYQSLIQKYEQRKSEQLIGSPAPAIVSKTDQGADFKLSALKGKLVLLDFWASWCTPCRAGNQKLKPIYEQYKNKGFEIVSYSFDNKENLWKDAIKKDGIPWIQISDLHSLKDNKISDAYHVKSLPTIYLIDEQGNVIAQNIGKDELVNILQKRFGSTAK